MQTLFAGRPCHHVRPLHYAAGGEVAAFRLSCPPIDLSAPRAPPNSRMKRFRPLRCLFADAPRGVACHTCTDLSLARIIRALLPFDSCVPLIFSPFSPLSRLCRLWPPPRGRNAARPLRATGVDVAGGGTRRVSPTPASPMRMPLPSAGGCLGWRQGLSSLSPFLPCPLPRWHGRRHA